MLQIFLHLLRHTLLYLKIGEPDDGSYITVVPGPLRALTALSAVLLSATLVTGTLVTAAGPHAGDKSPERPVPRLEVEIVTLVHLHGNLLIAYLCLLIGLGAGLLAIGAPRTVTRSLALLVGLVVGQGLIGVVQYRTGVPAALVAAHVAGAAACTAATAALWAAMRQRTQTETLQGGLDVQREVALK